MSEGPSPPLFRAEALKWRQESWIGSAQIAIPVSGRIASLCSVVFAVLVCMYIGVGSYTRRVHANGLMLPPSGLVVAEADQGGIVSKVLVQEGLRVKAADLLFFLDVSGQSVEGATGRKSLESLLFERQLLKTRRTLLTQDAPLELSSYREEMTALQKQQTMLSDQVSRDNSSIPLIERAMNEMRVAIGTHLVTESQFQSQLYTYMQFMNARSQTLRSWVETGGQMTDLRYKIDRHPYKIDEALNDIDVRLANLSRQIAQAHGQSESVINARVAGTVDGIRVSVGQRVVAGQPLASLLPDDTQLLAELYVNSQAIGFVRPGQRVLLKYVAYPYHRFGLHEGTVIEVTKSPLSERSGSVPKNGSNSEIITSTMSQTARGDIYRIRVQPDQDYVLAYGQKERLKPGMAVEAEIAIDHRRLYQWLLDPVLSVSAKFQPVANSVSVKGSP
ncbi:hypothetical protein AD940_01435 [Gluconobacter thailandicus]|uniref:HlyD family secretion protein n=1 Tax=Gluconobacter thailandicus TaxID=257438 RepID=UPI0007939E32|nr:HlyD family efflux transporter periplasmic adaptor subunit [Gluconobacter thailandicus]KXV35831.1 hypothetical protein AD940_01435 [Gluconobacter thailandicus]